MWRRNLTFIGLLIVAAGMVVGGLQYRNRVAARKDKPPADWDSKELPQTVARLNADFAQAWEQRGLHPTPPTDNLTLARRLSLALTGTVPSLEEIRALENKPPSVQVDWWLDHLLSDRRSSDYLAERLTRALVGTEDGPFLIYRRRRFVTWLSDQLQANRRYDEIVHDLLAEEGLWTSKPAVNFVTVTAAAENHPDPIRLASRASRALLGMRIDCLQCHDDHLGTIELGNPSAPQPGTQHDFHRLAAFFAGAKISLAGVRDERKKYEYQFLNEDMTSVVEPGPPFAKELLPTEGRDRERFARWVTHPENKPFARAIVNRVWALLLGKPIVSPIDDIPLSGEYPPGLEILADDFIAHHYDLHRLIRIIATSEPFRRSSRANFEITSAHEESFAAFPLTRLRPEQVAGALIQASTLKTLDSHSHILFQLARYLSQSEFVQRYGDIGDDEFTDRGGTITQRLLLMNGEMVKEHTKDNFITNAVSHIALFARDENQAIQTAYLAVLTRQPTDRELAYFSPLVRSPDLEKRRAAIEDLYWMLLNSTEFSWNH